MSTTTATRSGAGPAQLSAAAPGAGREAGRAAGLAGGLRPDPIPVSPSPQAGMSAEIIDAPQALHFEEIDYNEIDVEEVRESGDTVRATGRGRQAGNGGGQARATPAARPSQPLACPFEENNLRERVKSSDEHFNQFVNRLERYILSCVMLCCLIWSSHSITVHCNSWKSFIIWPLF